MTIPHKRTWEVRNTYIEAAPPIGKNRGVISITSSHWWAYDSGTVADFVAELFEALSEAQEYAFG